LFVFCHDAIALRDERLGKFSPASILERTLFGIQRLTAGVWGLGCRVWETSTEKEWQKLRESPSYGGFEELSAIFSFWRGLATSSH